MRKRQRKKIVKKDWAKRGINFVNGNKIDFEEALEWVDTNLLSGFESADMSWLAYVGDDENKDCDQSFSYCPDCAEEEVQRLVKDEDFKKDDLIITSDSSSETDGCESCETCGINLNCSSLGTWINQELDHWEEHDCDQGVLFNLVQTGADQIENEKEGKRAKKLLLSFFQNGEYIKFLIKKLS